MSEPVADGAFERRMTLEEWADLPEDEEGELVDGVVVEDEMAGYLHEMVVGWLLELFRVWLRAQGGGVVGSSDAKFAVREQRPVRGRKPDLTVFFAGRKPPAFGLVRIPPDIAVEVVTPRPRDARRDRVEKLGEYAEFGITYYWIVDPQIRALDVLARDRASGRYVHALAASEGKLDDVPGCPGLVLDLDALWAECDALDVADDANAGEPSRPT